MLFVNEKSQKSLKAHFLINKVFQIRVRHSDSSEETIILTKKLVISMGAYININNWLHVQKKFKIYFKVVKIQH